MRPRSQRVKTLLHFAGLAFCIETPTGARRRDLVATRAVGACRLQPQSLRAAHYLCHRILNGSGLLVLRLRSCLMEHGDLRTRPTNTFKEILCDISVV